MIVCPLLFASCHICLPFLRMIRFLSGYTIHFPTLLAVTLVYIFIKTHAMNTHEIMLIKALTTVFYFMLHSFLYLVFSNGDAMSPIYSRRAGDIVHWPSACPACTSSGFHSQHDKYRKRMGSPQLEGGMTRKKWGCLVLRSLAP